MNLLSVTDFSKGQVDTLIRDALLMKKSPKRFGKRMKGKVLMTFFQLPSLRTEVSFDMAMYRMGGEIIDYHSETSPWSKGKESIEDVARVVSRYVDGVMMRITSHADIMKFAKNSKIPVINGLTEEEHPCQILSDLMTMKEHFGKLKGLKLAYLGDGDNNVTNSLLLACKMMGIKMVVCCPKNFSPQRKYAKSGKVRHDADVSGFDVVYTDSWMSYAIPKSKKAARLRAFKPFQVNAKLMKNNPKAIFMHCLPATRGMEVTKSVIDGKQSVVWDQAENRMHMEKAILLKLL